LTLSGVSYLKNEVGRDIILVVDSNRLCRRVVGSTGKFCSCDIDSCPIQAHTCKKASAVSRLYIQSGSSNLLETLFLLRDKLPDGIIPEFLEKTFSDMTEIVCYFNLLKSSLENDQKGTPAHFTSLEACNSEVKAVLAAKTPRQKRKVNDLSDDYQEICEELTTLVEDKDIDSNVKVMLEKVKVLLDFFFMPLMKGKLLLKWQELK
jgi:hypothetical protein